MGIEAQLKTLVNVLVYEVKQPTEGNQNVGFAPIVESFDKAELIRNLGEKVGTPKLVVSIPTYKELTVLARLYGRDDVEAPDEPELGLLESFSNAEAQPIEDALFRVLRLPEESKYSLRKEKS